MRTVRDLRRVVTAVAIAASLVATASPTARAEYIYTGAWDPDVVVIGSRCDAADFITYRASNGWTVQSATSDAKQRGCTGIQQSPVVPGQPQSYFSSDPNPGSVLGGQLPTPHPGDATDDSRADLWVVQSDGTTTFYRKNSGAGYTAEGTRGVNLTMVNYLAVTGDMDGDGVADVLFRDSRDQSINIAHVRSNGYLNFGYAAGSNWGAMNTIWFAGPMVAGSSQNYVLARRSDGTLWRYKLVSGKGLVDDGQVGHGWNGMTSMLSPGSFNGDGTWDVIGVRDDGRMFAYAVSNGVLGKGHEVGHGWGSMRGFTPGDLTGDGRLDILGLRTDGTLWSYANLGNGTWGPATRQMTGLTSPRALA